MTRGERFGSVTLGPIPKHDQLKADRLLGEANRKPLWMYQWTFFLSGYTSCLKLCAENLFPSFRLLAIISIVKEVSLCMDVSCLTIYFLEPVTET